MIQWLNLLTEATVGTAYDEPLKLVSKQNDDPDKAFSGPTFAAVVESIKSRMEKPPTPEQLPTPTTEEDKEAVNSDVEFEVPEDKDGEKQINIMNAKNMDADTRAEVKRICNDARLQLRAQVQLVPNLVPDLVSPDSFVKRNTDNDLFSELMKSAVFRAVAPEGKVVAVFFDPKLAGEATHRPNLRTCTVRQSYAELVKTVLKRNLAEDDPIGPNDAFFLLDTNKQPAKQKLMEPFAGKDKVVKYFHCWKDENMS